MTKAVILSGGKGVGLRPLTYEIPKGLIPVQRRKLLDHVVDLFYKYNVFENWLVVGHLGQQILDTFPYPYVFESKPLGTGGFLFSLMQSHFSESFFVCNGDNLFNINLDKLKDAHISSGAVVTIACTKVKDVRQYGSVHIKEDNIISFEEKKKSRIKKSGWVNGGYYMFSPQIFSFINDNFVNKKGVELSLEKDVFPLLAKQGKLKAFKSDGQWFDTGDFSRWEKVIKEWKGV